MGNCVRKDYDNQWGGDYWGSPESSLLSGKRQESSGDRFSSSDGKRPVTEVKIKITKKQLGELLCMKEMHGLTLDQVLNRMINGGDRVFDFHQRSWCPALQSIPE
ncbi:hypothetical protein R6Q59_031553 [Mikania micrantha]|uniref:Uncharacterized protein n=1 Tax=Mikania micrantha TaxID=192012 RepID=A0A5N6NX15_9ASTR|nr:hypothetical protein E3N88_15361 [Mikania micrantha]